MTSGNLWKQQRKFSLSALRSMGVGKSSFEDQISSETNLLMMELANENGRPFDPRKLITNSVSNVICSVVFGKHYSYDDAEFLELLAIAERHIRLVGAGGAQAFIKCLQYLPTKANRELIKNADRMENFVQKQIDEHVAKFDTENIRDYTDVYLQEMKLHEERGEVLHLKAENVRGAVNNVFGAGVETTSTTLRWAFLYMIAHPDLQRRVQDELDAVIGRDRLPRLSDRLNLPFTMATILEIQRHASILFLGFPHLAECDTTLCGYDIQEGAMIISNLWAVHHDPRFWSEPERFIPERFLDDNGAVQQHEEHMIPFSIGTYLENIIALPAIIVDSSNTDLNSAWMGMGLRSVFDESTIRKVDSLLNPYIKVIYRCPLVLQEVVSRCNMLSHIYTQTLDNH